MIYGSVGYGGYKIPIKTMLKTPLPCTGALLRRKTWSPARVPSGYRMILGPAGTPVWAEYSVEGYRGIPAGVTVAEGADWSYNATDAGRQQYRAFFSRNPDPYRNVIRTDVDVPISPDPGAEEIVINRRILLNPVAVCGTCTENPSLVILRDDRTTDVTRA